ncbi:uncharacterized protein N7469_005862 [Penicillium citrinum]|uniref:Uncharacterized protein n=1 Tax=Penicillium citrinum TaxID=5077 RepID=A0A9W9NWV5_PENCI|nr:uncharacterized protein N7469_005862 [Penicillium citrinum]KAJ5231274.1 hypothetical protein N7469_005862 [Penicillium citrinum]
MHWLNIHQYRVQQSRGCPTPIQTQAIQATIQVNIRPVLCQYIFAQGPGSHYICVAQPNPNKSLENPAEDPDSICQLMQTVEEYQQQDQKIYKTIIQAEDLNEAML